MEFLILGIVVALNIVFIKMKIDQKRYEDAVFDTALLVVVTFVFSGTYSALVVGTIASMFISIFLYASPPKWFSGQSGFFQEFKKRASKSSTKFNDL